MQQPISPQTEATAVSDFEPKSSQFPSASYLSQVDLDDGLDGLLTLSMRCFLHPVHGIIEFRLVAFDRPA